MRIRATLRSFPERAPRVVRMKGDLAVEVLRRGFTDSLATLDTIRSAHPRSARAALHDMVGALLVSRAVVDVAPDLSDEVLGANRSRLKAR